MYLPDVLPQTYDQNAAHLVATTVALGVIDVLAVGSRFYARKKQGAKLQADDWFSAAALVFAVGYDILVLYAVSRHSLGYRIVFPEGFHTSPLEFISPQTRLAGITQFAYYILTPLAVGCYKASILFFYLRIFAVHRQQATRYLLIALIGIVIAWIVGFFFAFLFQCGSNPVSDQYDVPIIALAHCPHQTALNTGLCISDFAIDLVILLFPIPLIWRLNMSRQRKLAVSGAIAIGSVTVIASLIRLIIEIKLVKYGFNPKIDQIYFLTREAYWVVVLLGTGTFSVCLPSLHVLLGSESLAVFVRSTREFFYQLSFRSGSSPRMRDSQRNQDANSSKGLHRGAGSEEDQIYVLREIDVKSQGDAARIERTPSQDCYLKTTTETRAMSSL